MDDSPIRQRRRGSRDAPRRRRTNRQFFLSYDIQLLAGRNSPPTLLCSRIVRCFSVAKPKPPARPQLATYQPPPQNLSRPGQHRHRSGKAGPAGPDQRRTSSLSLPVPCRAASAADRNEKSAWSLADSVESWPAYAEIKTPQENRSARHLARGEPRHCAEPQH